MWINQCHQTSKHTVWHATEPEPVPPALHLSPAPQCRHVFWQLKLEFCRAFVVSALAHHKLQQMKRYLIANTITTKASSMLGFTGAPIHLCKFMYMRMCVLVCLFGSYFYFSLHFLQNWELH